MKARTHYVCEECGATSQRWLGRCHDCGSWNSLIENVEPASRSRSATPSTTGPHDKPRALADIQAAGDSRIFTGVGEFDRVLGGGIVAGSVVLLGGEPGIGKSTLLLQVIGSMAETNGPALYVSGEESLHQLRLRAQRLGVTAPDLFLLTETRAEAIVAAAESMKPSVIVVDSVQTTVVETLESTPGSVSQIREAAAAMMRYAKATDVPVFLVGHVTKEGTIAGPKVLEHMVDTVIYFEGDLSQTYRIVRATKNRYGSTNELGVFEMSDAGLVPVEDPSAFFLDQRHEGASGSVVVCALEGSRPMLLEVQALVSPTRYGTPARVAPALDRNRVALLIAVLEKRGGLPLQNADVFVNVTGGIRVDEPAVDLGLVIAIASSAKDTPVDARSLFIGEVGLSGEVRGASRVAQRLTEAQKLGFERAIICARHAATSETTSQAIGMEIVPVRHIREALDVAL